MVGGKPCRIEPGAEGRVKVARQQRLPAVQMVAIHNVVAGVQPGTRLQVAKILQDGVDLGHGGTVIEQQCRDCTEWVGSQEVVARVLEIDRLDIQRQFEPFGQDNRRQ